MCSSALQVTSQSRSLGSHQLDLGTIGENLARSEQQGRTWQIPFQLHPGNLRALYCRASRSDPQAPGCSFPDEILRVLQMKEPAGGGSLGPGH